MGCSDPVAYVQKVQAANLRRLMMLLTCVESSLGSRKKGMALSVLHPYVHSLTAADGEAQQTFFHWDFRSPLICFDAQRP